MNISYNTGGAHAMAGYIKGIQDIVETDLFLGSAVSVIQAQLTNSFDLYADGVASTNRAMYHHVYDYDGRAQYGGSSTVGDPRYRLWAHASAGNGRTRIASFKFLPSKRPVPRDPRVLQPPYSANTGVHIFVWKAPVFEYGIEVTIAPTIAKRLIFVNYQGGVQFGNFTVRFVPGRGQNTRAFTNLYYGWWKTMAGKEFKRAGLDRIMADNIANEKGIAMATTKAAKKPFSIMTGRNNNQEFKRAQRAAHTHMKRLSGRYIDDAARRRMILYGY